jgi:hypothetical protein
MGIASGMGINVQHHRDRERCEGSEVVRGKERQFRVEFRRNADGDLMGRRVDRRDPALVRGTSCRTTERRAIRYDGSWLLASDQAENRGGSGWFSTVDPSRSANDPWIDNDEREAACNGCNGEDSRLAPRWKAVRHRVTLNSGMNECLSGGS